jgi:hypothetical protein
LLTEVEDDGWFFDTELLLLAERNGLRIHEVAVDWIDDPDSRVRHEDRVRDRGLAHGAKFALGRAGGARRSRAPSADDFGRRLVSFAVIGAASTAVSLALYLWWRRARPVGANARR